MRKISPDKIKQAVSDLCIRAGLHLRDDVRQLLKSAYARETNKRAKDILRAIINNASIAEEEGLAICQDTGLPVVFLEIGQDLRIRGDLKTAVNRGIESGYRKGCFRKSVVMDPLLRGNSGYAPAIIHTDIVSGNRLKITVYPRGFGCENKSSLKMFNPTAGIADIRKFIIETVKLAGPDACPPYVIGVGIGGTADYAALLAKKVLFGKLSAIRNTQYAKLESDLLKEINRLNIGPMGLGGKVTALAVKIATHPTHIAGLPVAVSISCHALRSASITL